MTKQRTLLMSLSSIIIVSLGLLLAGCPVGSGIMIKKFTPNCLIYPDNFVAFQTLLTLKQEKEDRGDEIYSLDCKVETKECIYHRLDLDDAGGGLSPLMARFTADSIVVNSESAVIKVRNVTYSIDTHKNEVTYLGEFEESRGGNERGSGKCK
jgi:hypothetical protein